MLKIRLALICAVSTIHMATVFTSSAETYHIRADGEAFLKVVATSCSSAATAMPVSVANGEIFLPGDRVILCSEGGVFRTTLYLTSGGASGNPITYDGRGTAVLSGSDLVSGWTATGDNIFVAAVPIQPHQLFVDGGFGDRKGGSEELADELDWFWESGNLFLVSPAGNPAVIYGDPGVEASSRDMCFGVGQASYVIVEGITVRHSNSSGVNGWNPGSDLTVRNLIAEWNWHVGFMFNGIVTYSNITIEDNTARFNGTGGIAMLGPGVNAKIYRNKSYENGKYQSKGNEFHPEHEWTYGIKLWESSPGQEGNEVLFNECFSSGRDTIGDDQGRGVGIWMDGVRGNANNPNVLGFNKIYNNTGNGIFIEISSNAIVQSNLLFNNATNTGGVDIFTPANIAIDARNTWVSENNLILNNTSFGGRCGVKVVTYDWNGCSVDNNVLVNNIIVGATEHNLYCNFGGDNDGDNGSGNVYEYNSLGEQAPGFINWGNIDYDTYAAWESVYGAPSYSVKSDPQLVSETQDGMYLLPSSPCRDSGANLGSAYDDALRETSIWTESVRIESQDALGPGWEIGAYNYSGDGRIIFSDPFEGGSLSRWSVKEP